MVERIYGGRRHLGELRKPAECRRFIKEVQGGIWQR